ncbi:MAG: hypothetical protein Tsb0019_09190 [Roseibium sp.]
MLDQAVGAGTVKRHACKTQVTGLVFRRPEAVDETRAQRLKLFGALGRRRSVDMRMQMIMVDMIMAVTMYVAAFMMMMIVMMVVPVVVLIVSHGVTPHPDRPVC